MYCTGGTEMPTPGSHSVCAGRPENSLHQERTHAEWFSQSKCLETLASRWNKQKFRCYEAKIEESEKGRQPPGIEPRTPSLCSQCSATELRQPDNHQPPQSSICTAQVGLKCQHLAATQYVRVDRKILSIRREPMLSGFLSLNA